MKRITCILSALVIVILNTTGCNAQSVQKNKSNEFKTIVMYTDSPVMIINDTEMEIDPGYKTMPIIRNNHVLIPIRSVMEQMGCKVDWNNENHTISIYNNDNRINMTINSEIAYLNNQKYILNSSPVIINSKTFIPIRFISEGFGFSVDWNESQKKITITNKNINIKKIDINSENISTDDSNQNIKDEEKSGNMININIKIGNSDFSAKLYDNPTVNEFIKNFPITYNMSELHGNEKYYYMPNSFPTDSEIPDNINKGDIMLYGSDCLVIFYNTFPNSYSYTRLGYIENTSELENAVGKGNVEISFKIQ